MTEWWEEDYEPINWSGELLAEIAEEHDSILRPGGPYRSGDYPDVDPLAVDAYRDAMLRLSVFASRATDLEYEAMELRELLAAMPSYRRPGESDATRLRMQRRLKAIAPQVADAVEAYRAAFPELAAARLATGLHAAPAALSVALHASWVRGGYGATAQGRRSIRRSRAERTAEARAKRDARNAHDRMRRAQRRAERARIAQDRTGGEGTPSA